MAKALGITLVVCAALVVVVRFTPERVRRRIRGMKLTDRRIPVVAVLVAVPIAIGGAVLVGLFAARDHEGAFDWELASIFGTALGTLLLAGATALLALVTSRDVTATEDLARTARDERRDRFRPMLIGAVDGVNSRELSIELMNVGPGPAITAVVTAKSEWSEVGLKVLRDIPSGESRRVKVSNHPPPFERTKPGEDPPPQLMVGNYQVDGHYFDWDGKRYDIADWKHNRIGDAEVGD
jgi:hypothetical protein